MDARAGRPWEWSPDQIRRVGYRVVDLISEHLTNLPQGPVFRPFPPDLADQLRGTPPPQAGQDADTILAEFAARVAPYPLGNGHPRFWAWVNFPPTVLGIFAEALSAAMNPSCAGGNHAVVHVERQVIDWFKQLVGLPPRAMGLLVSGGSMATLTALAVARHVRAGGNVRARGLQGLGERMVVYTSAQGHDCIRKAVELLGIGGDNLRTIPVDGRYRMRVPDLEAAVRADREAGRRPIAVVAGAGTVNTGAIDPLAEVAEVCRRHGLWLHVDGAYGAPAILTARYRPELEAMALADSVALDPHKWLYVPVEAGLVLVRDAAALRATFRLEPPYLKAEDAPDILGETWLSEYGFQLTRGFRALKVWMALKYHGLAGYAEAIEHDLALAEHLADRVREEPDLELSAAPSLSIVCFRYAPADLRGEDDRLNNLNRRLVEAIQRGGRAFLAGTRLGDRFVLRACIINPRSTRADLDLLVELVKSTGERIAAEA